MMAPDRVREGLSIVIPVSGRPRQLERLLDRLARVAVPGGLQVIVVDNPLPSNGTWTAARTWPFRLTHVHCPIANRGQARNVGAAAAGSDLLLFVDSDIVPGNGAVEALLSEHREHGVITMADVRPMPGRRRSLATHLLDVPAYFRGYRGHRRSGSLTYRDFVSCSFLIGGEDFARLGGFDQDFRFYGYEDVEFGLRAQRGGVRFGLSRATVYHHKELGPRTVLDHAEQAGRSAVHLVELHPSFEETFPLGIQHVADGRLAYPHDFDLAALLRRAELIEQRWQQTHSTRTLRQTVELIDDARSVYAELRLYGRYIGITNEMRDRQGAGA